MKIAAVIVVKNDKEKSDLEDDVKKEI